jgi:hypothetical protein
VISWFEFRHLLQDIRVRRIHDYSYAKRGPLHTVEGWLRRLACLIHGHDFYGGEHGEWKDLTWKRWCRVCFKVPEWVQHEQQSPKLALVDDGYGNLFYFWEPNDDMGKLCEHFALTGGEC